jgi:hypothetical protein
MADHQRTGRNLAAYALEALRHPSVHRPVSDLPYPRVVALLNAVADAPTEFDSAGNWYFSIPGSDGEPRRRMRVDEIPLPAGTPPICD